MKHIIYENVSGDAAKVTSWFRLYQEKLLKETGEKLPDMEPLNMEQYAQMASLTPEEYLNEAQKQAEIPEREPVKKTYDSYKINIQSIDPTKDVSMREVYGLGKELSE